MDGYWLFGEYAIMTHFKSLMFKLKTGREHAVLL